ncbi:MAG: hypothetical protein KDC18_08170 [Alphaproteobacteria bacterium]|nr:hypothetical protein [Alphaproteobacteria bacterium]MCB9930684.1 hypothetical protein [Alphaproteobacteria bacterium]
MTRDRTTGKRTTTSQESPARPDERVRYEVYGMAIDEMIRGALAPEREEAARAEAKAKAEAEARTKTEPQPDEPAWPSLEDLKAQGPHTRRGRR